MNAKFVLSLALMTTLCLTSCQLSTLPPSSPPAAPATPINSTTATTVRAYLNEINGRAILAGQMDLTWAPSVDMLARVNAVTGKYPALVGYDFMDYTNKGVRTADAEGQTTEAIAWWSNAKGTGKKGLVAINWHWRDPSQLTSSFYKSGWTSGGATDTGVDATCHIPLNGSGQFDPTTPLGTKMKADMDFIAAQLKVLKANGVTVLWRPLHEGAGSGGSTGSGAWFWWGQDGAAAYKALYQYMYTLFTNTYGLTNLIWVWNGQDASYYPGDNYVDIGGWDVYNWNSPADHGSQKAVYSSLKSMVGTKPVALSEVGAIPDPDAIKADGAWFLWFMVWNDATTTAGPYTKDDFWSGTTWNTGAVERAYYNHALVLTLDELPPFTQ